MKYRFSPAIRFLDWLRRHGRGQSLTEFALIAPVFLLVIGGVGDLGRAFYYKIAVTNVAREAAHWATLLNGSTPPDDTFIIQHVATPSQESFGLQLALAQPVANRHATPPFASISGAANPGGGSDLQPNHSYLYVYRGGTTLSLKPGQHWQEVASGTRVITAQTPERGGLAEVLRTLEHGVAPVPALADANHCYTWPATNPQLSPSPVTLTATGSSSYQGSLSVTLSGASGQGNSDNYASLAVSAQPAGFALQSTWSPNNTIDPQNVSSRTDTISETTYHAPGTYGPFTVTATSVDKFGNSSGCPQQVVSATFNVVVPSAPSPSPVPSPSPTATPTAVPSPTALPTPGGGGPGVVGDQITCTVIYYFTPITPLLFVGGTAIYIVGTATLQATY